MPKKQKTGPIKQRKGSKVRADNASPNQSKVRKAGSEAVKKMSAADNHKQGSKQAVVISLLQRPDGTTLAEIIKATGWQAHTVRGVISGVIRKKLGLIVLCEQNSSGACTYRIKEAS